MTEPWLSEGSLALLGAGAAFPGEPVTTAALLDRLGQSLSVRQHSTAEAIAARLQIATRHVARRFATRVEAPPPGQANADLAAAAVRAALADAGVRVADLGFLIGHTATPSQPLPANIALVADRLGYAGPHLELRQACTGFASALVVAFGLLARPGAAPVAIVGSETGSAWFDPADLGDGHGALLNLVQMGDGAGAVVLGAGGHGARLSHAWSGAIGLGRAPGLQLRRGGSDWPASGPGPLVFDHDYAAIAASGASLFDAGVAAAARHGVPLDAVATIIPHQVSGRIGGQLAAHFGVLRERFFGTAASLGNTGSAAIWTALAALRATRPPSGTRALVLGAEATKFMHGGFVYTHG